MVSGSAPLPEPVFSKWQSITGHQLLERYGMTEIGMALSNPLKGERRPGNTFCIIFEVQCYVSVLSIEGHVGFPLPGVRVRIAELKTSTDASKTYYDTIVEGNHKATKVEPGKVIVKPRGKLTWQQITVIRVCFIGRDAGRTARARIERFPAVLEQAGGNGKRIH